MDADSLRDLVESAKSGDTDAFEQIMTAFGNFVFSIAYHATGSRSIALDICQETWVRVWKALPRLQPRGSFPRWLETIAQNAAIDYLRKRRVQTEMAKRFGMENPARTSGIQNRRERAEHAAEITRKLLNALPPHFRTVVVLFELQGRSITEVASLLGENEGTVRVWLHRARAKMRQLLVQMEAIDDDEDLQD